VIADALANNTTLTTLNLFSTDSIMHWRRHQRAELINTRERGGCFFSYELLWSDNELGVEGAEEIAKVLESNHTLTTLNLGGTDSVVHW
jgi:hypothetical protein